MKSLSILFAALWLVLSARAEFIVEETQIMGETTLNATIKIKGERARVDTEGTKGPISLMFDFTTGKALLLNHDDKVFVRVSIANLAKSNAGERLEWGLDFSKAPKPVNTGRKVKIGEWETEVYETKLGKTKHGETSAQLFLAKDLPHPDGLLSRLAKIHELNGFDEGFVPAQQGVAGHLVKVEFIIEGTDAKLVRELNHIKPAPLDDSIFQLPADYEESPDSPELDHALEKTVETGGQKETSVLRVSSDQMREDFAHGKHAGTSLVIDTSTLKAVWLRHGEKKALATTIDTLKSKLEAGRPAAATAAKPAEPRKTGRKEKIGEWETEVFELPGKDGTTLFWVATEFPNYRGTREQLYQITAVTEEGLNPFQFDLKGLVVKSETTSTAGAKTITQWGKFVEAEFEKSVFDPPKDYAASDLPTPETKDEYVIEQKISDDEESTIRVRIKGDQIRMDILSNQWMRVSVFASMKGDSMLAVMHEEKMFGERSLAEMKKRAAAQLADADHPKIKKPVATKKTETLGEWKTTIFQTKAGDHTASLWVAKDIPNANFLRERLSRIFVAGGLPFDPHAYELGGLVVKFGRTERSTIFTKLRQEPVSLDAFRKPGGYREFNEGE